MSAEQNKSIVRRWVDGGWNSGNLGLIDELFSRNYVMHDPTLPMPVASSEAFKQFVTMYRAAFPDIHFTIENIVAEGDKVAWTIISTGTHQGPLANIPPTGRTINVRCSVISRFDNGKWAEDWVNLDMFSMLQQLGVIPVQAAS